MWAKFAELRKKYKLLSVKDNSAQMHLAAVRLD